MEESPRTNEPRHEVRLLDLVATIIRYRGWVIWTTAIGSIVAAATFFLLPSVGISLTGAKSLVLQITVRVVQIPSQAAAPVGIDVSGLIQAQATDLNTVAEVYKATLMTNREAALPKPAFNRVVRSFIEKSFHVTSDSQSATMILRLRVKEDDQEKGSRFLKQFVEALAAEVKLLATTQIEQAISSLDVTGKASSEIDSQARAPYEVASRALKGVLANPNFPLAPVGDIVAMEDEQGLSPGVAVFSYFLGSLIAGILLAFLVDAVDRTRRDPISAELLQKAWKRE